MKGKVINLQDRQLVKNTSSEEHLKFGASSVTFSNNLKEINSEIDKFVQKKGDRKKMNPDPDKKHLIQMSTVANDLCLDILRAFQNYAESHYDQVYSIEELGDLMPNFRGFFMSIISINGDNHELDLRHPEKVFNCLEIAWTFGTGKSKKQRDKSGMECVLEMRDDLRKYQEEVIKNYFIRSGLLNIEIVD